MAHSDSKNSRFEAQYTRADPLGILCRVFPAHRGRKPRLFIFWVTQNGSNITAVFVYPFLLLVILEPGDRKVKERCKEPFIIHNNNPIQTWAYLSLIHQSNTQT